jgi:predicted AlkP superfamily pyrophosphatase or phosphodiesterase
MQKTVVINIVALSKSLIGDNTPFLTNYIKKHQLSLIKPAFPAVTTTMQSNYLTGQTADNHGIVANGWYDREDNEVKFWKQSNALVKAEKIWEAARKVDPKFTVSNMFWWYNMYSKADFSVTPRPQYHADGKKMPDCYSQPADLRDKLQKELGTFPLFSFWGPNTNIKSTQWIADASILVDKENDPTLTLIYLPHLDYCLQKYGVDFAKIKKDLIEIDQVAENLVKYYESVGSKIIILSEYGINNVNQPIHINRILRENGLITIREEQGLELLDCGASKAFATADHQIAHVYIQDKSKIESVKAIFENIKGIAKVLDGEGKKAFNLNHERSGDLVLMAESESWFTYYYWLNDSKAPDFARCVDIHKKPGYDPVELFMNPKNPFIKLRAGYKLVRKLLGFRYLIDVIPLDANLIKGSHGSTLIDKQFYPLIISENLPEKEIFSTDVYGVIWGSLYG